MPRIAYIDKRFSASSLNIINQANQICESYASRGYSLTLRQLYYQFVSWGLIANKQSEYKRLGSIINDARLAGYIDWSHMEDRTRNLKELAHWDSPADILNASASQFRIDKWKWQPSYVEVWIEKDALIGVLDGVCTRNDVPYFSCRGYTSQSEVWGAAQRLVSKSGYGERPVRIIHLGDHDPSGIDMTRDIDDRLAMFMEHEGVSPPIVNRIALNSDQIRAYNPPPNPAKITDSRAAGYIRIHGRESWELDALSPEVITDLIQEEIDDIRDEEAWEAALAQEERGRRKIRDVARGLTD